MWLKVVGGSSGYSFYRNQRSSHSEITCPAKGKSIRCTTIDAQVDVAMRSLTLMPSWKERVIELLSGVSEQADRTRKGKRPRPPQEARSGLHRRDDRRGYVIAMECKDSFGVSSNARYCILGLTDTRTPCPQESKGGHHVQLEMPSPAGQRGSVDGRIW